MGNWKDWIKTVIIDYVNLDIYKVVVYTISIFLILSLLLYQFFRTNNNSINKNFHSKFNKKQNGDLLNFTNYNDKPISLTLTNILVFFGFLSPLLIVFFIFLLSILSSDIDLLSFTPYGSTTYGENVWYNHNSKYTNGFIYLIGIVILIFINAFTKKMFKNEQSKIKSEICNILPYPFTVINNNGNVYNTPALGASILSFTLVYILYGISIKEKNTVLGQKWNYYGSNDKKPNYKDITQDVPFLVNKLRKNITYFSIEELESNDIPNIKVNNYVTVNHGNNKHYYVPDKPIAINYKNKIKITMLLLFLIILNYTVITSKLCTNNAGYLFGIILGVIVGFIYHFFTKDTITSSIYNEFSNNLECNRVYDNKIKDTKEFKCNIFYNDASGSYGYKNGEKYYL